jgi:hypothetical protein
MTSPLALVTRAQEERDENGHNGSVDIANRAKLLSGTAIYKMGTIAALLSQALTLLVRIVRPLSQDMLLCQGIG